LALSDVRARYKRSVLGPLWLTLGTAAGSVGLGLLWSELLKIEAKDFVPSLTAGLILWQFISGVITESSTLYGRQAAIIRNMTYFDAIYWNDPTVPAALMGYLWSDSILRYQE